MPSRALGANLSPMRVLRTLRAPVRLLLTLLLSLASGALAGAILGATARTFYLPGVFPVAAGLVAGSVGALTLRWCVLPGAVRGASLTGLGGLAALATALFVAWSMERAGLVTELGRSGGADGAALADKAQAALAARAGEGVLAPFRLRLEEGVAIAGSVRLHLGAIGNGVILALEALLAIGAAAALGYRQGGRPFSTSAGRWLTRRLVGSAALGAAPSLKAELAQGNFHRIGRRLASPDPSAAVQLWAWTADEGASEVVFELEARDEGARHPTALGRSTAPATALRDIAESRAMA